MHARPGVCAGRPASIPHPIRSGTRGACDVPLLFPPDPGCLIVGFRLRASPQPAVRVWPRTEGSFGYAHRGHPLCPKPETAPLAGGLRRRAVSPGPPEGGTPHGLFLVLRETGNRSGCGRPAPARRQPRIVWRRQGVYTVSRQLAVAASDGWGSPQQALSLRERVRVRGEGEGGADAGAGGRWAPHPGPLPVGEGVESASVMFPLREACAAAL